MRCVFVFLFCFLISGFLYSQEEGGRDLGKKYDRFEDAWAPINCNPSQVGNFKRHGFDVRCAEGDSGPSVVEILKGHDILVSHEFGTSDKWVGFRNTGIVILGVPRVLGVSGLISVYEIVAILPINSVSDRAARNELEEQVYKELYIGNRKVGFSGCKDFDRYCEVQALALFKVADFDFVCSEIRSFFGEASNSDLMAVALKNAKDKARYISKCRGL